MAGKKKHSWERTLRRYALAGNKKKAEYILRERLKSHPDDSFAKEELERLQTGQPLRVTESPAQRQSREQQESLNRANHLLTKYPKASLEALKEEQLLKLHKELKKLDRKLKHARNNKPTGIREHLGLIKTELRKKSLKQHRNYLRKLAVPVGSILVVLIGVISLSYHQASKNEQELSEALSHNRYQHISAAVKAVDIPIYRLLYPQLNQTIREANQWIANTNRRVNKLTEIITRLEQSQGSISAMRLSLRAEIEQDLLKLPEDRNELAQRWQKLSELEREQLTRLRDEYVNELLRPLPPVPPTTGNTQQDFDAIHEQLTQLLEIRRKYREAPASYHLNPDILLSVNERENLLRSTLADISAYRRLIDTMSRVRTYRQHLQKLQAFQPSQYPPALQIAATTPLLPTEESVKSLLRDPAHPNAPSEAQIHAATCTHMRGQATYTAEYPANMAQVHLAEDIFTAPSLYRKIYEVSNGQGEVCYTESRPEVDETGRIRLIRSDLDPAATLHNRDVRWEDDSRMTYRIINAGTLMQKLKIDKAHFFSSANIPHLLTSIINFHHPECPALAQAFVYHRLLMLLNIHEHRFMTGINFSPTMRRHASEFSALMREHHLTMSCGLWVNNSPDRQRAEAAFRLWFNQRRGTDYSAEIRKNFEPLLHIGIIYCGYTDENGTLKIFRELQPSSTIWYMTEDGFVSCQYGDSPQEPLPFSPIFCPR